MFATINAYVSLWKKTISQSLIALSKVIWLIDVLFGHWFVWQLWFGDEITILMVFNLIVGVSFLILQEYEAPLYEKQVISKERVKIIFKYIDEITQCHQLFNMALYDRIKEWNDNETIGDVIYASVCNVFLEKVFIFCHLQLQYYCNTTAIYVFRKFIFP